MSSSSSSTSSSSISSSSTSLVIPSLKHFWYTLRDTAGEPREGETVYAYEATSTASSTVSTLLYLYDFRGRPIANPMTTSTGTSGVSAGIIDFFLRDEMWPSGGYEWDQRIALQWDHDGVTKTADRIMTWGDYHPVYDQRFAPSAWGEQPPLSGSDIDDKNKAYSNLEAYKIERHRTSYLEEDITPPSAGNSWVHQLQQVQWGEGTSVSDSANTDLNKVTSNANWCEMLSYIAEAAFPRGLDTDLIFKQIRIVEEGTESEVQYEAVWVPSAGLYYADIVHYMGHQYPYGSTLWDEVKKEIIYPVEIEFISSKYLRIWVQPGSVPNDMTLVLAGQGSRWSSSSSSTAGIRITENSIIRRIEGAYGIGATKWRIIEID